MTDRANFIAELLNKGVAVCLSDLRGIDKSGRGNEARGRRNFDTELSSSELMLGGTTLRTKLKDLRSILRYLRTRTELDTNRIVLYGDSFAPTNPSNMDLSVPFDVELFPELCEPLGGLLALFGALFEDNVRAVYICGGMTGYASLLESQFCYVPHDVIVSAILTVVDLCDIASFLAPMPLRMEALVDGLNRLSTTNNNSYVFKPTLETYKAEGVLKNIIISTKRKPAKK